MPDVTTSLCYLARVPSYISEKPYKIVAGADETYEQDLTNIVAYWHHNIRIEDIRAQKSELKLEQHGFEVLSHTSQYPVLDDVAACTAYKEEASAMLREHLKAEKVICFDFRHRIHTTFEKGVKFDYNDPTIPEGPAVMAHSDHTFDSGLSVINAYLTDYDKRKYLTGEYRLRLMNTWRSLLPVVEDQPLAFCDPSSTRPQDLVECDRVVVDKLGAVYLMHYHSDQRWCWLDGQTSSEPFIFVTWDSKANGQARYCPHTSFANTSMNSNAPPRESVETRSIVITHE